MLRQRIGRVPGDIVISGRYQQTLLWAAFVVILALGLAEAVHAQSTSTGKTQSHEPADGGHYGKVHCCS
jgi:hypothetical protein